MLTLWAAAVQQCHLAATGKHDVFTGQQILIVSLAKTDEFYARILIEGSANGWGRSKLNGSLANFN